MRILSLGAGVQSTTLALMAKHGDLSPAPDCAIFADTGSEPRDVYEHLGRLVPLLPFPVYVVRAWEGYGRPNIKAALGREVLNAALGRAKAGAEKATSRGFHSRPPFFVRNPDGSGGLIRRQCTGDYKIEPIERKTRELLGIRRGRRWPIEILVEQWIGISTDEATRAKPAMVTRRLAGVPVRSPHPTIRNRWPLLDAGMSRRDCIAWLKAHGYAEPPKSACTFCPFHSDTEWRRLRDTDADGWREAVELDRAIRTGLTSKGLTGALYLHRARVPLDEVDLSTSSERQINLFENECEGMCGV